jgi:cellulose synthase/poly-beta-1,6-N-acetylglucosamine synthase-like glycosyltransferase
VELLRLPARGGKTAAENAARSHLRGDVVVNTDASVRLELGALRTLLAAFADPRVGAASGRDVSVARLEREANVGEGGYVDYEMWIRDLETAVDGIVGASGCFYAIRKPLHLELVPEALSRDFAAALVTREHGLRTVSVRGAVCYVPRVGSLRREYTRKVRTFTRGLQTLFYKRHLLNPFRYGVFAWMLWSHKVCRWLVPWAALIALAVAAQAALREPWARIAVAPAAVGLVLAAIGWVWPEGKAMPRMLSLPAYVVSGNLAVLHAWVKAFRGDMNPVWEPTRRASIDVR